ncbi:hypothetical protein INT45_009186 [Circinella minor]|uniref:Uncharacterized protein n=1 Tax=Circinella minor TaxID=1195481 RepID=A0A8H7VPD9_9FUNG|nr:hypothetical protein INT45_009186 [Circinella minor]
MFDYRYQSYKHGKMLASLSDERILSLSFIFILGPNDNKGFVADAIRGVFEEEAYTPIPSEAVNICNEIDNLRKNKNKVDSYLTSIHIKHFDESHPMHHYFNIISMFTKQIKRLGEEHTEQDHDSYELFTKEVFHSNKYRIHKLSKHLAASKLYIPDYKVGYEYKPDKLLDLCVIERKSFTPDKSDKIKINLELQIMPNQLVERNILTVRPYMAF